MAAAVKRKESGEMMLTHIYIKNFAIIREIDIDLEAGLNIITGETGTGKSIVIQAISTALGGRGSSSLVAKGCDRALVQLIFSLSAEEKERINSDCDYSLEDIDEDLIISRDIHASGKSIARINGRIVNLSVLSSVTSLLIDIHGQYDNQMLLNSDNHMKILDSFTGEKIFPVKKRLALTFENYQTARRTLAKLLKEHGEYLRRQDFLRYELDEITAAAPIIGEDEELTQRLSILQNSEKIYASLNEVYELLYENSLERCAALLSDIADYDTSYAAFLESVQNCLYTLEDTCAEIRKARDNITFSPEEIDTVLERIDTLEKLKRKYGGTIDKVLEYRQQVAEELNTFENIDDREKELKIQIQDLQKQLDVLCGQLTALRKEAAVRLSEEMTDQLTQLNFKNVQFAAKLDALTDVKGRKLYSAEGTDLVEFFFNANKGAELKPLADVASGGEISRISLAFKCLTEGLGTTQTMIFDEIDTGISGITASVVGKKMSQLGQNHQILCITHLPQIAAAGDHQYQISKDEDDDSNYTTICKLNEKDRITEIARLLGGMNITPTTLASAEELLQSSKYRENL